MLNDTCAGGGVITWTTAVGIEMGTAHLVVKQEIDAS